MEAMDKLLWQSATNLLSIITTQLRYLADVGAIDQKSRDLCVERARILREIGQKLIFEADQIDRRARGAQDVEFEAGKMVADLTEFLRSIQGEDAA